MSRLYHHILKPVLFQFDPEKIHHFSTNFGNRPIIADIIRQFQSIPETELPLLEQHLQTLHFTNPIGLAAGFDKNAQLAEFSDAIGFGFREVGSITAKPSSGNPKPRLFRIPQDHGLINRMGLNNDGADIISLRIEADYHKPAVNIAKTHDPSIEGQNAIYDYVYSFKKLAPHAKYITLNISCPNTAEGKTFENPEVLKDLMEALSAERSPATPPVFVKFSADLTHDELSPLLQITEDHEVNGYICCNTSTDRSSLTTSPNTLNTIGKGGISGKPVFSKSSNMLSFIRQETDASRILIGVGGIDGPLNAHTAIGAGADLLQIYTGLIYEGPTLVRRILKGFLHTMKSEDLHSFEELKKYLRSQKYHQDSLSSS